MKPYHIRQTPLIHTKMTYSKRTNYAGFHGPSATYKGPESVKIGHDKSAISRRDESRCAKETRSGGTQKG